MSFKYPDLKPAFDIYLHPPCTSDDDARAVAEVVHSGWATPGGPWVARFEEKLQTYTGAPQVVALQSGTAALHLVLLALGIGEGDRVIVPAHTFIATASPVHYTGAVPVVVDSETDTLNISPRYLEQSLERLQKEGTPAKAVIVTHIYGLPARMDEILTIADRYKIPVIEDAAESVGSFYGKRHTGTLGAAGILSFNGNKTFTTAGGGALLLRDEQTARQVRQLAAHAKEDLPYYYHRRWGYNYQLSALSAGLGISQLEKHRRILQRKRVIHREYGEAFAHLPLRLIDEMPGTKSNYWLNALLLESPYEASELIGLLQHNGIEARHFWYPLHQMPVLEKAPYFGRGESETFFRRGVLLPSSPCLKEDEQQRIIEAVRSFFA